MVEMKRLTWVTWVTKGDFRIATEIPDL